MKGRTPWSLRVLPFSLGLCALSEIGLAREVLLGIRAAVPPHVAVIVDALTGVGGLPLAWALWRRSVAATYWLPAWCAGFAASWFMVFLGDVKPVDHGAIVPFAVGLIIWTAGTLWIARQIRLQLASDGPAETAR